MSAPSGAALADRLLSACVWHQQSLSPVVVIADGRQEDMRCIGDHTFPVVGSRLWNSLPSYITSSLEDSAHHLSVLLLYAFRQLSSIVGTDIPMRRVVSYTIVAKRLDGRRRHLVRK